jgi:hypothetical protein
MHAIQQGAVLLTYKKSRVLGNIDINYTYLAKILNPHLH